MGRENVAKKVNLRPFKLYSVYLHPLNLSNAGNFSWNWIPKDFIQFQNEERKIRRRNFTSSIKSRIRGFHVVVVRVQ